MYGKQLAAIWQKRMELAQLKELCYDLTMQAPVCRLWNKYDFNNAVVQHLTASTGKRSIAFNYYLVTW